jgi:hypothetical protein
VALILGLLTTFAPDILSQENEPGRGRWVPSWKILYGGFRQVIDLSVGADNEGWGVETCDIGSSQRPWLQTAFVHWADGDAAAEQIVNSVELRSIAMAGSNFGLAVGRHGAVYRYNGSYWSPLESPMPYDLTDVDLVAPDDGWIVGSRATILRWDGKGLTQIESPVELIRIVAVDMVAHDQAWAVTKDGRILKFDGAWALEEAPEVRELVDVSFRDSDYGLAVGLGVLERVNGRWRAVPTAARWTTSVAWEGESAYVIADDEVLAFESGKWAPIEFEPGPVNLGLQGFSSVFQGDGGAWATVPAGTTVWIEGSVGRYAWSPIGALAALDFLAGRRDVGWSGGASVTRSMLALESGHWRSHTTMPQRWAVDDISLVSEDDGWAVVRGFGVPSTLWRLQDGEWSAWPIDKLWRLSAVEMGSTDDGWAVGDGIVARWNGEEWSLVEDAPTEGLTGALSVLNGGDSPQVWIGAEGAIHHLREKEWLIERLSADFAPTVISVAGQDIGWATDSYRVLKYNGSNWWRVDRQMPRYSAISDLHAPRASEAWFLTGSESLLRWSVESGWEKHALSGLATRGSVSRLHAVPYSVEDERGTDVWLVGGGPTLARYSIVAPVVQLYAPVAKNE